MTPPGHRLSIECLCGDSKFARKRAPAERCELCSAEAAPVHSHLLEPENRQILCACEPCALLFDGKAQAATAASRDALGY